MNLIDRAISIFSPKVAYERQRYRAAMSAAQHYDAAAGGRRTQGWRRPAGDANSAVRGAKGLRDVSRDMVRNNAIARRAVYALVNNAVGDGIIPHVSTENEDDKKALEDLIREHCDTTRIDAAGRHNLYGLQRAAMKAMVESGECLFLRRPRLSRDRLPIPMQIELLESDYIDDRNVGLQANGNNAWDGIEFDLIGRRVGYQLFREHPYGEFNRFPESRLVPASSVIHLFDAERPGQRRGIPWLAPVMMLINDAFDYADAQLMRQKISAMWVAFIRDTQPDGQDVNASTETQAPELVPGMMEHLGYGRDVTFSDPPQAAGYAEFMRSVLHMVAAALGITYEALAFELSDVNFSSARMGRMEMNRTISAIQWTILVPTLCQPFEAWLRDGIRTVRPDLGPYRIDWTPPRFAMVDPTKEVPALIKEIEGGLTSRSRAIRERGYDPETIYDEIELDDARAREAGFSFAPEPQIDLRTDGGTDGGRDGGR